jgi:hypothetical protein
MPDLIGDFIEEVANAPGNLATFSLAGPINGARAFASRFPDQSEIMIGMLDGAQAQTCRVRLTIGTPNQITILQVMENTANTTSRLNFTGATRVYSRLPASRSVAGSVRIREDVFNSLVGAWVVSLPPEFSQFIVEWQDVTFSAASAGLYFRLSTNGGTSWIQGATDYPQTQISWTAGAVTPGGGGLSYGQIAPAGVSVMMGDMSLQPTGARTWMARSHTVVGASVVHTGFDARGWAGPTPAARATNLMIAGISVANLAQGRFRLLGVY